jgi:exodeoxyribonuclease VII large subunit
VHILGNRPALSGLPARLAMRSRDVVDMTHGMHRRIQLLLARHQRGLAGLRQQLDACDPSRRLGLLQTRLATAHNRLQASVRRRLERSDAHVRASIGRLDTLSPLAVLGRGYAVAWNHQRTRALRSATEVAPGDRIRVTLASGELECDVRPTE